MIVYNISMKVTKDIEESWLRWQQEEHIPDIMSSGLFIEHKFFRLLEDDVEGSTYVVQYFAASIENYNEYVNKVAPLLRKKAIERWGDRFIAFRSLMEVVN